MGEDRLAIYGSELTCSSKSGDAFDIQWKFTIADLKCIGEYTLIGDPIVTDYFIVFFAGTKRYQATMYADGRDDVLTALSQKLGATITPELGASTSFASQILWPPHLRGHPLFIAHPEGESQGLLKLLWTRVVGGQQTYDVNPSIADLLREPRFKG